MSKEEIEDILEELHLVRPEILAPKAKKLFEAIMSIADERDKFQQENQELKKQLEEYKRLGFKHLNDKCNILEIQQKEFINYLEDYINSLKKEYGNYVNDNYSEEYGRYYTAKEILQKYKSIIGVSDDKTN